MNLTGKLFIILTLFLSSLTLSSQTTVTALVDRKSLPINESLTLTISINSNEPSLSPKVELPAISDFNIYSSGKSSNISIINGQITTSIEYYYTLTPKRTGKFIIPKIGVFTGREKYFTKEIEIEVTSPSISQSQPVKQQSKRHTTISPAQAVQQNKENLIFVNASVDKKTAYPGEQITLSIKFYTALPIASNPQYFPPSYSNLIAEELPPIRTGTEIINGIKYYFAETKTALFGIMSGQANISSAKIIAPVQQEIDFDPFDPNFIQKFFSQGMDTKNITLQTKAINIQIKEFPPAPTDFSGAVGNFFMTAKIDNPTVHAGDTFNIIVEISGKGNVKQINPPQIVNQKIKIYDTLVSENITKNNDVIGGTKKITYIATPLVEGNITLEPIKFTFFNIDTQKYETITSNPLKITSLKAKENKSVDFDTTKDIKQIEQKATDIKYIKEKVPSSFYYKTVKETSSLNVILNIAVIIILLILSIIKIKSSKTDISLYRSEKALSIMKKKIEDAKKHNSSNILSVIYESVYDYFSSKLNENISHMSFIKLKSTLQQKMPSVSQQTLGEIEDIINRIEFLNFTKTTVSPQEIDSITEKLINTLIKFEKEIKK